MRKYMKHPVVDGGLFLSVTFAAFLFIQQGCAGLLSGAREGTTAAVSHQAPPTSPPAGTDTTGWGPLHYVGFFLASSLAYGVTRAGLDKVTERKSRKGDSGRAEE